MADYSPACPTCGTTIKNIHENLEALDKLLMAQNGKRYPQQVYEDMRDSGEGGRIVHPTLGTIKVHFVTDLEPDSYGDYIDGDGYIIFQVGDSGDFLRKDFDYNSYGTVTWPDSVVRKVSQKAKTVTVYEYE